jgi:hypothetical protein
LSRAIDSGDGIVVVVLSNIHSSIAARPDIKGSPRQVTGAIEEFEAQRPHLGESERPHTSDE